MNEFEGATEATPDSDISLLIEHVSAFNLLSASPFLGSIPLKQILADLVIETPSSREISSAIRPGIQAAGFSTKIDTAHFPEVLAAMTRYRNSTSKPKGLVWMMTK